MSLSKNRYVSIEEVISPLLQVSLVLLKKNKLLRTKYHLSFFFTALIKSLDESGVRLE